MAQTLRRSPRKPTYPLQVTELRIQRESNLLARGGVFVEVSENGFKIIVNRRQVALPELRHRLDWSIILGETVTVFLDELNLDLEGVIRRAHHVGRGRFELGIDYTDNAPSYWRSCLVELLPRPGEVSDDQTD